MILYPCLDCGEFKCTLGVSRCEMCQYGHAAAHCPERIEVSTYEDKFPVWVHGRCESG